MDDSINQATNHVELIKYGAKIHSRIKTEISSDAVLCKLNEQDKIGSTEMTVNAYLASRLVNPIKKAKTWIWEEEQWKLRPYEQNYPKRHAKILDLQKQIFNTFMTKIIMTFVLNRNVERNHLMLVLAGIHEGQEEIQQQPQETDNTSAKKIKNMFKKEEEKKND